MTIFFAILLLISLWVVLDALASRTIRSRSLKAVAALDGRLVRYHLKGAVRSARKKSWIPLEGKLFLDSEGGFVWYNDLSVTYLFSAKWIMWSTGKNEWYFPSLIRWGAPANPILQADYWIDLIPAVFPNEQALPPAWKLVETKAGVSVFENDKRQLELSQEKTGGLESQKIQMQLLPENLSAAAASDKKNLKTAALQLTITDQVEDAKAVWWG